MAEKLYSVKLKKPWVRDERRYEGTEVVGRTKRYEGGMTLDDVKETERADLLKTRRYTEDDFTEVSASKPSAPPAAKSVTTTPPSSN